MKRLDPRPAKLAVDSADDSGRDRGHGSGRQNLRLIPKPQMSKPTLALEKPLFWWQWHGRQMFMEVRNDPRFPRKLHRVVYHLADTCKAPTEAAARKIFRKQFPEATESSLLLIGPVIRGNSRNSRKLPDPA